MTRQDERMPLHARYKLSRVINARGTFTPLGVSRSSPAVAQAVAEALQEFFVIDELHALVGARLAAWAGAEAAAVTHCASAAITLSIAAVMTGGDPAKAAALPDAAGMRNRVVLPAGHAVDYGHPIVQDIRLAGAIPQLAGTSDACAIDDLERSLAEPDVACLLLVSSRLTKGAPVDFAAAIAAAHRRELPVIVDGAAQDLRVAALLASGADLVLVSAQKYLAAPTAGLVAGRRDLVRAVRVQDKGIGRAMKTSKEALVGVLQALEEREQTDLAEWAREQARKVDDFVRAATCLPGVSATAIADATGLPFSRAALAFDAAKLGTDAREIGRRLATGTPSVWVMDQKAGEGELMLELVALEPAEIGQILARLRAVLS